jgi:hypothetical protein
MKQALCAILLVACCLSAAAFLGGCGMSKADGPKSWWDDQKGQQLPADYQLPPAPAKTAEVKK